MAQRGAHKLISDVDRQRIITAFENNKDWIKLAEDLGIKRQSARNVVIVFMREQRREALPRGGNPPKSLSAGMVERAISFVEEKPIITLKEIQERLIKCYPEWSPCTLQTISSALDKQLITLKLARTIPNQWNIDRVKNQRKEYAEWMMSDGIERHLIFLDEMGANVWTSRSQGRSVRGQRAVRICDGQRGRNLTVCLAASPNWGLLHWKFIRGGMTKDLFSDFLSELSVLVPEEFVLIFDNARAHFDPPNMLDNQSIMHLPPYSPFLNMVERVISCLKAHLKRSLSEPDLQRELGNFEAAQAQGVTLQEHRLQILQRELEASLVTITADKCNRWNTKSMLYMTRCLQKQDIYD